MVFREQGGKLIMKDTIEPQEVPEKQITKNQEKQIETYDDLKTANRSGGVETYDNIQKMDSRDAIKTYDDIADSKETGKEKTSKAEVGEKVSKDTPESLEQKRLDQAAEAIKNIEVMKPEKWKTLSDKEKIWALDHCGKALRDAYNHPNPPLFTETTDSNKLGDYGDGYSYDKTAIYERDYGIRMNEEGVNEINKKLFGDDPNVALETYGHEFRHSYQCEQAHTFDQGLRTDDPVKAAEWSGNLGENYKPAPDAETAKTDPEEYIREYEAYKNQPVERDAREFGEKISSKLYGEIEKR